MGFVIGIIINCVILIPLWIKWKKSEEGGWKEYENLIYYIDAVVNITLFIIVLFVIIILIMYRGDKEMPQGLMSFLSQVFVSVCSSAFVSLILYFGVLRKLPQNTKDHVNQAMDSKVLVINNNTDKTERNLIENFHQDSRELIRNHQNLSIDHSEIKQEIRRLVEDMVRREGMKANDNSGGIRAAETAMQVLIEKIQNEEKLKNQILSLERENQRLKQQLTVKMDNQLEKQEKKREQDITQEPEL